MIDIILVFTLVVDQNHAAYKIDNIPAGDVTVTHRDAVRQVEFLIQLVAPHPLQVIMTLVKQLLLQESACIFQRCRISRTHTLEEFNQGFLCNGHAPVQHPGGFLANGGGDEHAVGVVINILEEGNQFLIRSISQGRVWQAIADSSQCTQENGNRHCALAIEFEDDVVILAGFKFHPCAAVRDQLGKRHAMTRGAIRLGFKIHTRRADQLGNHHTFRTVDDERTLFCHFREVPKEYVLLHGFGHFGSRQQHRDVQRGGIGQVTLHTLIHRVLGLAKPVA